MKPKTSYEQIIENTSKTLKRLPTEKCCLKILCREAGIDYLTLS